MTWSNRPWSPLGWATSKAAAGAPFSPSQLTNLRGWWESDSGFTPSSWADKSGLGNNLAQGTAGFQPTSVAAQINGLPAILFDGVDDRMAVAIASVAQPTTVFAVVRQETWTAADYIWDGATSDTMRCFQQTASPGVSIAAGSTIGPNNNLAVGSFGLITAIYDGASGSLQINSTAATTGAIGASNGGGLTIGSRANGTVAGNVSFAGIIIMAARASAGEIASVKNFWGTKYNQVF